MKHLGANGLKIPLQVGYCSHPFLLATPYLSWTLEGLTWVPLRAPSLALYLTLLPGKHFQFVKKLF